MATADDIREQQRQTWDRFSRRQLDGVTAWQVAPFALAIVTGLGIAMATLVSIGVARRTHAAESRRADTRRPDTRLS